MLRLARDPDVKRIVGIDLSQASLARLRSRLMLEAPAVRNKVDLVLGSVMDVDNAFTGFDVAILLETIEHIEPDRLSALERAVFEKLRPKLVIITTPNRDKNADLGVPAHRFRHPDHRFEWGRDKFRKWARGVANRSDYDVLTVAIGDAHPARAGATQLALFAEPAFHLPALRELIAS